MAITGEWLSTRETPSEVPDEKNEPVNGADTSAETESEDERRERLSRELLRAASRARDEETRRMLLDEVVVLNVEVARSIAMRYRSRGIPLEDLKQVACLGLIKAARGYDPEVGTAFLAYCVPTIRGEIKRYFRDHGWTVKPPRRVQELQARIKSAESELSTSVGRPPRPSELASYLDEDLADVIEALAVNGCFTPSSLDRPVTEDSSVSLGDLLGGEDHDKVAAEARVMLAPVVRTLSERDRKILMLRFFRGWTQSEIAEELGVTQMQVSRLLSRILRDLHRGLHAQSDFAAARNHRDRRTPRRDNELQGVVNEAADDGEGGQRRLRGGDQHSGTREVGLPGPVGGAERAVLANRPDQP